MNPLRPKKSSILLVACILGHHGVTSFNACPISSVAHHYYTPQKLSRTSSQQTGRWRWIPPSDAHASATTLVSQLASSFYDDFEDFEDFEDFGEIGDSSSSGDDK